MEAKILKSFLNDFNHVPEMDKMGEEKPSAEIEIESEGKEEEPCKVCEKAPCECEGKEDLEADKPMLDAMLKGE